MDGTGDCGPAYGVSAHYLGAKGREYFALQSADAVLNGEIESHKFQRYIRPDDVVIDFGCGGGYVLKALRCARRIGVEVNPHARSVAIANGIECYERLEDVPDRIADAAISNHALEHVPYPIEALRQLKEKVKPGGMVIVCVPMEDWRAWRDYNPQDVNHHLQTWNAQTLGNTLAEAGFEVTPARIRILTHCWPPRFHGFLYRHLPLVTFDWLCALCARVLRRRQLLAVLRA